MQPACGVPGCTVCRGRRLFALRRRRICRDGALCGMEWKKMFPASAVQRTAFAGMFLKNPCLGCGRNAMGASQREQGAQSRLRVRPAAFALRLKNAAEDPRISDARSGFGQSGDAAKARFLLRFPRNYEQPDRFFLHRIQNIG